LSGYGAESPMVFDFDFDFVGKGEIMDIKQLQYFVTIVECNCNLSEASKKIHISQPALSKMIRVFEEEENVLLFERSYGRLERLSPAGELFYAHSQNIIEQYNSMLEQLREEAIRIKGKIRIGIPPLVLSTVFSEVISGLIINNPSIKVDITEIGAYELRKSLILQEVDIAILLEPVKISSEDIEEIRLTENQLCAFMDKSNKLALEEKLSWSSLDKHPMAIFDKSFMIHHQLTQEFENRNIKPKTLITSSCWDFLLRSTIGTDLVTILPSPILGYFSNEQVAKIEFDEPLSWKVVICRCKKRVYSRTEEYVFKYILNHFGVSKA